MRDFTPFKVELSREFEVREIGPILVTWRATELHDEIELFALTLALQWRRSHENLGKNAA